MNEKYATMIKNGVISLVAIGAVTFLMGTDKIAADVGMPVITLIVGLLGGSTVTKLSAK